MVCDLETVTPGDDESLVCPRCHRTHGYKQVVEEFDPVIRYSSWWTWCTARVHCTGRRQGRGKVSDSLLELQQVGDAIPDPIILRVSSQQKSERVFVYLK